MQIPLVYFLRDIILHEYYGLYPYNMENTRFVGADNADSLDFVIKRPRDITNDISRGREMGDKRTWTPQCASVYSTRTYRPSLRGRSPLW